MVNQSRRPLGPWDKEPATGRMVVDLKNDRLLVENYTSYPGIGRFGGAWALKGAEGYHWEPDANHHGSEWIAKLAGADADGPRAFVPRFLPPFALLTAWNNGTNLRHTGAYSKDGREFDVVTFVQRDRSILTLSIDSQTGLLEGFENIRDDGVHGDVMDFVRFSGYREIAGVMFPTYRTDLLNGEVVRELTYRLQANTTLAPLLFELPTSASAPSESAPSDRIAKIGEGVYLDTEMGGVMIVEFKDFLVVVECPGDYWMSQSTIDAVAQKLPGKPIRYVVPSHTHGDHGGGARAYYQLQTAVLTTPGNTEFYRRLANIRQTIRPDPQSLSPKPPIIETFSKKRVISDGFQILELHDVGPNAHSEELTIAYLPKQRLVWQADLVFTPMTGRGLNRAMPITVEFAGRLRSLGLADFHQMVEAHHSRLLSAAEFQQMLRMAERPASPAPPTPLSPLDATRRLGASPVVVQMPAVPVAAVRRKVALGEVRTNEREAAAMSAFEALRHAIAASGGVITGAPMLVNLTVTSEVWEFEVQVSATIPGSIANPDVVITTSPGGLALAVDHEGPRAQLGAVHSALAAAVPAGFQPLENTWEQYMTPNSDPGWVRVFRALRADPVAFPSLEASMR
jgi:glyoxylase-like metal-dependent hydrolase (beta-lactamase superfamily II)